MAAHPYWSRTPGDGEMWCEGFDGDLLNVVPGAIVALGDAAEAPLLVNARASNGKLNHPSVWNGAGAFFWTPGRPEMGRPGGYSTDDPVVACTFGEAVRDCWSHTYLMNVNRQPVWQAKWKPFERLMYDARGWTALADAERVLIGQSVRDSLTAAANRLRDVLGGVL